MLGGARRLPLWRLQLDDCAVILTHDGASPATLSLNGVVWREGLPADRTKLSLRGTLRGARPANAATTQPRTSFVNDGTLAIDGTLHFAGRWMNISYAMNNLQLAAVTKLLPDAAIDYVVDARGTADLAGTVFYAGTAATPDATLTLMLSGDRIIGGDALANATFQGVDTSLTFASLFPLRAPTQQRVSIQSARFGKESPITNLKLVFDEPDLNNLHIADLQFDWAGGHVHSTRPAALNPERLQIDFALAIDHVSLNEFAKIVSGDTASGEGQLSGRSSRRDRVAAHPLLLGQDHQRCARNAELRAVRQRPGYNDHRTRPSPPRPRSANHGRPFELWLRFIAIRPRARRSG